MIRRPIQRDLRRLFALAIPLAVLQTAFLVVPAPGQVSGKLVSRRAANRVGMQRAWYSQMPVSLDRGRITQVTLFEDLLLVLTDQAALYALDAESGAQKWSAIIGNPNLVSLGPAANKQFVAVINGATLYLLDRVTGEIVWNESLRGGPGGGPALSDTYAFAPLINGVIRGYSLNRLDEAQTAWSYPSVGHALIQPGVSKESVFWATDRGYLYVASADDPQMRFRLETHAEIVSKPAFKEPLIFAGSRDGYVYAVDEISGVQQWKYSTGEAVSVSPAAIEDHLFVCSEAPRMHCLMAAAGTSVWSAAGIERFVAASPTRVYGVDRFQNVHILDRASGSEIGQLAARGADLPLVNQQTDRLYLVASTGLIQCLHETAIPQSIRYEAPPLPDRLDGSSLPEEGGVPGQPAADPNNPFADVGNDAGDNNPFK